MKYIDIPGAETFELPPLLVSGAVGEDARIGIPEGVLHEAGEMLAQKDESAELVERRQLELALTLREQYKSLQGQWQWGNCILEWVRQCEITFENDQLLRSLLHPDVWPHASRASFVQLLVEKNVPTGGVSLSNAVGLRLTFRHPPPIDCFSNQFLFYLSNTVTGAAYTAWSQLASEQSGLFPPNRFHMDVVRI